MNNCTHQAWQIFPILSIHLDKNGIVGYSHSENEGLPLFILRQKGGNCMKVSVSKTISRCSPHIFCYSLIALFVLLIFTPCMAQGLNTNGPIVDNYQDLSRIAAAGSVPKALKSGFYLTNTDYSPSTALTACATGYHMASIWELMNISALTYHSAHPSAHNKADDGYGPPSHWYGWVRTGWDSSANSTAGSGNCLNWTSSSNTDYGVSVRLSNAWATPLGSIGPWEATSFTCDMVGPVWCVSDKKK